MTGRLTDRNCNHNDGHSEKDLSFSESADDCRPISGDFHPRQTNRSRYCYADTRNTFPNHAFQPLRETVFPSLQPSPSADYTLRFRDSTHRMPEFHCKRTDIFVSSDFLPIYNANIGMARYVDRHCKPFGCLSTLAGKPGKVSLQSRDTHSPKLRYADISFCQNNGYDAKL